MNSIKAYLFALLVILVSAPNQSQAKSTVFHDNWGYKDKCYYVDLGFRIDHYCTTAKGVWSRIYTQNGNVLYSAKWKSNFVLTIEASDGVTYTQTTSANEKLTQLIKSGEEHVWTRKYSHDYVMTGSNKSCIIVSYDVRFQVVDDEVKVEFDNWESELC